MIHSHADRAGAEAEILFEHFGEVTEERWYRVTGERSGQGEAGADFGARHVDRT